MHSYITNKVVLSSKLWQPLKGCWYGVVTTYYH